MKIVVEDLDAEARARANEDFREGIVAAVRRGELPADVVAAAVGGQSGRARPSQAGHTTVTHVHPGYDPRSKYAIATVTFKSGQDRATCPGCGATVCKD